MLNCLNEILTFSDNITILFKRDTKSFEKHNMSREQVIILFDRYKNENKMSLPGFRSLH